MIEGIGKNRKGFTLIELVVVVAILAILAAVAVPQVLGMLDKTKQGMEIAGATEIANAINLYNAAGPNTLITQSDVNGWSSRADVESNLGGLTPHLNPDNFAQAIARINVDANGVATVDTTIG